MPEYFYARILLCREAMLLGFCLVGFPPLLEAPAAMNEQPP